MTTALTLTVGAVIGWASHAYHDRRAKGRQGRMIDATLWEFL